MDNDEIRLRIAKGLGYRASVWSIHPVTDMRKEHVFGIDILPCISDEIMLADDKGDCPVVMMFKDGQWVGIPNWPADDAAALSLLTGPVVDAGLEWIIESQRGTTWCKIVDGDHIISMGIQDTVAAAICAAVLAWMEKTEGESNMDPPVEDK